MIVFAHQVPDIENGMRVSTLRFENVWSRIKQNTMSNFQSLQFVDRETQPWLKITLVG